MKYVIMCNINGDLIPLKQEGEVITYRNKKDANIMLQLLNRGHKTESDKYFISEYKS